MNQPLTSSVYYLLQVSGGATEFRGCQSQCSDLMQLLSDSFPTGSDLWPSME